MNPPPPPTYKPSERLAALFLACEKSCVKDCCGIGAFDFSPLFVASYLAMYSGCVSTSDVDDWHREINQFEADTISMPQNELGLVCVIDELADGFCADSIRDLAAQLRHCVSMAPQMCQLSQQLASPVSIWDTHRATSERIRAILERR